VYMYIYICIYIYIYIVGLHVKKPIILSDFNKFRIFLTEVPKILKYKNLSSERRVVPSGRTDRRDEAKFAM
jgi:hypothetical protein